MQYCIILVTCYQQTHDHENCNSIFERPFIGDIRGLYVIIVSFILVPWPSLFKLHCCTSAPKTNYSVLMFC